MPPLDVSSKVYSIDSLRLAEGGKTEWNTTWGGLSRKDFIVLMSVVGNRVSIYGKALLDALFLTHRNLAVPKLIVKQQSNNDVHGYDIYNNVYSYRRGLRRCSFRTIRAMPEPRWAGWATVLTLTLLFVYSGQQHWKPPWLWVTKAFESW